MDDVIIVGSLDKKELEKSIQDLVNYVGDKTNAMANKFTEGLDKMKLAMKDFAITQKVSVDTMQEAWRKMSQSFDAMVAAQSSSKGGASNSSKASGASISELRNNISIVEAEINKIDEARNKFVSLREEIAKTARSLSANKKDLNLLNKGANLYEFDEFGNKVALTTEKVEKKIKALSESLSKLMSERLTTPAPSKEELQRYDELQRKLVQLKELLNKAQTPKTVGDLEKQISAEQQYRKEIELGTQELREQNQLIAEQKARLKDELMTEEEKRKAIEKQNDALERQKAKQLKQSQSPYLYNFNKANSESAKDIASAEQKLRNLKKAADDMRRSGLFDEVKLNKAQKAIDTLEQKIERMRSKRPLTVKDVLGMDESSVDAIAKKMQALRRVSIDPNNKTQVKQLGDEYQRLSKLQTQLIGKNAQAIRSNNMLAQSFGYIRNRVVYALTLGAMTNFVKQVLEIRGQYELLERSLGVLVGSFERGSEIFNELNQMAIKSPFTLIELGTAAKQLTAYNFAADEVVDTTRRLADISAALGVSMERLTYNLGQIKAQGVLNARDARDFANAGLAIVPMLAQMYTEQKRFGDQVVTTAQVYDMMSKKLVSYSDVLQVLYKITDEGGKFYDFQAKQAETLKVQINNLALAMNNMYNEIGASNQGFLVSSVQTIKKIFENWKTVLSIIQSLIVTYGAYRTILAVVNAEHLKTWGARIIVSITQYVNAVRSAQGAMATFNAIMSSNVVVAFASALLGLASYFVFFRQSVNKTTVDIERFGESGAKTISNIETLGKILKGVDDNTALYKKTVGELNQVLQEYGVEEIKNRDEINSKIERTIELVQEESAQRQRANMLATGQETYKTQVEEAQKAFEERLGGDKLGLYSKFSPKIAKELEENSKVISAIVGDIIQQRISLIANKTGEEYEKGLSEIYKEIANRLRAVGISEETIQAQFTQFSQSHGAYRVGLDSFIQSLQTAREELDNFNNKTEANYNAAKKATNSTMTFTEKIDANARALRNNANDAVSLYNKIYEIVELAQQNHVINFDLKLTAQKPPQWMQNIDLPELQRLAARFTAIAQSGGHAKGYTRETTYEQGLLYASAAREKQYKEERQALEDRNKHDKKTKSSGGGSKKDPFAESLKDEIELIDNIQKRYNEYRKIGVSTQEAITKAAEEYNNTLMRVNATLSKYGVQTKSAQEIANMDLRDVRDYYKTLLDAAKGANSAKGLESIEKAIAKINVEITKGDYKKLTDGLNNELGKLKDEYELGIELDANPELSDVFADMMGLNSEELNKLPRDFKGVVNKLQQIIDTQLGSGKFNLMENLNKSTFDNWIKQNQHGTAQDDAITKALSSYVDYANKVRRDETKKQIDDWNKLLEKYAEYEDKISKIEKEAEAEREIARKKNADKSIFDAIDKKAKELKAQEAFEAFQKTPAWITATGDLATLSSNAINTLIESIERYKKEAQYLTPKQIKQLNQALRKLKNEQRKNNPFLAISNAVEDAKERMLDYQDKIDEVEDKLKAAYDEMDADELAGGENWDKITKKIKKLKEQLSLLKKEQKAAGEISPTAIVEGINSAIAAAKQATTIFSEMAEAIGGKGMTDASKTLNNVVSILEKGGQGAAIGAQIGGGYGAAIGAVAGVLAGVVTTFADDISGNRGITKAIEKSEKTVRDLELAYTDLEHAMDNAYGIGVIGATNLALANKRLQLEEIKRQLALEESRKSKNKDSDKIADLKQKEKDLEYEIIDTFADVVNNMLGISSVGDAMENIMDSFIDSLRKGEDAMSGFNESIDDMIANMVKKMFTSKILQPWFEEQWDAISEGISKRTQSMQDELTAVGNAISTIGQKINSDDLYVKATVGNTVYEGLKNEVIAMLEKRQAELQEEVVKSSEPTVDDIRKYAELLRSGQPIMEQNMLEVQELLRELGLINSSTTGQLSGLQQGIQGVTEETAGALEAITNGISQQSYLQSDLLTQIRDAVVGFDLDVQTATVSQILLQLQNCYQVQMSIQSILNGWSNPNGMAVRVEMVS